MDARFPSRTIKFHRLEKISWLTLCTLLEHSKNTTALIRLRLIASQPSFLEAAPLRLPTTIERLYLDFDGFFASVEQQADKSLRGRPVGVVPFTGTVRTCVIACSREAKVMGCSNVMTVEEAKRLCPDIGLVHQMPGL